MAAALYKVFQPPTLEQSELALSVVNAFPVPPLRAVSLARALAVVYPFRKPSTADALTPTALALEVVGFGMDEAAVALADAYERPDAAALAASLKRAFKDPVETPLLMARLLKVRGETTPTAAPRIRKAFPELTATEMAQVLKQVWG